MPPAPKHTRRWFQVSLGMMFLLVTMVALVLGWELRVIRQRQDALVTIRERQGVVELAMNLRHDPQELCGVARAFQPATVPFWRGWLGDAPVDCLLLPAASFSKDELRAIARAFPESDVLRVDTEGIPVDDGNTGESN